MVLNPEFQNYITMAATKLPGTHAEEACWPRSSFKRPQSVTKPEMLCSPSRRDESQKCFNSRNPKQWATFFKATFHPVNIACQIVIHAWFYSLDPIRKVCFLPCFSFWAIMTLDGRTLWIYDKFHAMPNAHVPQDCRVQSILETIGDLNVPPSLPGTLKEGRHDPNNLFLPHEQHSVWFRPSPCNSV